MVSIKTFPVTTIKNRFKIFKNSSGLSLIEILIVIVLIAIIGALFTMRGGKSSLAADVEANRISSFLLQCYHSAIIGNKVVRIKLDKSKNEITFESANPGTLMPDPDLTKEDKPEGTGEQSSDGEFSAETNTSLKKFKIKREVKIEHIFIDNKESKEPYVYCFPQGYIQRAKIQIEDDSKARRMIEVSSLTGKSTITRGWGDEKK